MFDSNNSDSTDSTENAAPVETVDDSSGTPEAVETLDTASTDAVSDEVVEAESEELVFDMGDGKTITPARIKELELSGLRSDDYTRKSQVNADERKSNEALKVQITDKLSALDETLGNLNSLMTDQNNQPDWEYLRENDISEYTRLKELHANQTAAQAQAKQQLEQERQVIKNEQLALEREALFEIKPEWRDEGQQKIASELIDVYMTDKDFSAEEIQTLTNHRMVVALHDAAQFHAIQKKAATTEKSVQAAPKIVKATAKTKAAPPKTAAQVFYG